MNPERLSLVIDAIYRAAERRDAWSDALELVADALDARDTLLLFIDWTRPDPIVSESVRADADTLRAYNTHWRHHDAWVHSGHPLMRTEGVVVDGDVVVDRAALRATDFYRGFLAQAGLARMLGINAIMQRGMMAAVACMYPQQAGARTPAQLAIARSLLPHLRRALGQYRRALDVLSVHDGVELLVDRAELAAVLLDAKLQVVDATAAATRIIAEADGLRLQRGRLVAMRASDDAALARLVRGCAVHRRGSVRAGGGVLRVPRPSGKLDLAVEIFPHLPDARTGAGREVVAILVIADPARAPALDPQRVAAAFGLTAAEARVAAALVRADDVRELAQMLDIAPSTVHTHCKQIYRKLRVSGRTALVHALLEARPILAADRRRDR